MAWSQDIRDKVRNGYIFDQLPLDIVAMKFAVPHDTARRWKTQAMKNGDDWDKLRAAHALAGDGLESVARTVLISLVVKCQTTLERLNQNPEQRDKLHDWLTKTVMPLGEAGGKTDIIYIGTILHYDSVLSRTLNNPMWKTARFKAVIQWPANMKLWDEWEELIRNKQPEAAEALYRQNEADMLAGSVVSWAARPLLALMKIRVRDGHDTFDSEYQNDPVSGEDALFAGCIKFWVNRLDEWVFYGAVDPSLGKKNKNRDPSAILVGGFNRFTGILDVVEADIRRRLPNKLIEDVIKYQREYHCLCWSFESVQFQEFLRTVLVERSAALGVPVPALPVIPLEDKALRIESLHRRHHEQR